MAVGQIVDFIRVYYGFMVEIVVINSIGLTDSRSLKKKYVDLSH
jgi:hypothetical protein